MTKVLITGGKGFLGSSCADYFKRKGFDVFGIGHEPKQQSKNNPFSFWISGDCTLESLKTLKKPDLIIHCAGGSSVTESNNNPDADYERTVQTTEHVLRYMKELCPKTRLIFPSSAAVYGEQPRGAITTSADLLPISPYGKNKKSAEELCQHYASEENLDIKIIRFFSLYGEGLRKQLLWDSCLKLSANEKQCSFWGSGEELRDWVHVEDASRLIEKQGFSNPGFEILNGASGHGVSTREVIQSLKTLLKSSTEFHFTGQNRKGDPSQFVGSPPPDWKPLIGTDEGFIRYVNWFKSVTH